MKRYAFLFVVILAVCGVAFGDTWYVDGANTSGTEDGLSWDTAFTVIQDGIAAAGGGDEVWVASDTYPEGITLASGVSVYGGFDGSEENLSERDIANNPTVIDATTIEQTIGAGTGTTALPMNTYWHDARTQVIYLSSEIGSARSLKSLALDVTGLPGQTMNNWTIRMKHTSLSSFPVFLPVWETGWTTVYQNNETVSSTGWVTFDFPTPFQYNGTDNLMIDFSFNNSSSSSAGGCRYSTPGGNRTVYAYSNSNFLWPNPLTWSGPLPPMTVTTYVPNIRLTHQADHAVLMQSTTNARVDGFTITGGNADGPWPHSFGGGILSYNADGANTIANCTITGNEAYIGGGVMSYDADPVITDCTIIGNQASYGGGLSWASCAPPISNCVVSGNSAELWGGGVYCEGADPSITNCTISGNEAAQWGGGVFCWSSSPTITNTIFEDNTNHAIYEWDVASDPTVTNCLFDSNPDGDYNDSDTATTYTGADDINSIPDGFAVNNVDGDPLFVNKAEGDFHLRHGSPAIDTGAVVEIFFGNGMVTDTEPNDEIETAQNIDGEMWTLRYSADIGDTTTNTSESIQHVTILGTGNETFDVYSFTVANAGDRGIFDIDYGYNSGGSVDCYIRLYDSDGTMIDYDDDEINLSYGQGGSVHAFDSYLEHTFAAPGVYYIEVARYSHNPIPIGADYQLQISLENHEFPTTALPTDFDGEPRPIDVAGLGADGTGEEYDIGADEYVDSDDDGLSDYEEPLLGTDPDDPDTDNDGANDGDEVDTHGTDPLDPDSDDDELPDGWEVDNSLDPNDDTGDNGADGDPDGDGFTNLEEYEEGYDPQLQAPVAAFSASPTSGIRPLDVDFTDESTGSIASRAWDLGDGYDSTAQNPSHTYHFVGDFTVTLTVTGPGGVDSATTVIQVDQALAADARAYKAVINGIKVKYSKPTCFATYNDMQDSLVIAVWGDEPGTLNVIATDEALLHWGSRCDIVIDAPDTYIKKINLKGIPDLLDLYVCGQAGYVMNFILKEGYVGDTAHYGEEFGLGSDALDPAKKILIKNGATTAPLFGIGYSALRAIPASVAEALANLEMEIRLKSKPFVGPELADYEYDYEYDYEEDEDMKHAEIEFAEVEASVETKAAYVTEVDGVKVRYSKPGCVAYRNVDDGTLTIQITESDGNLLVKCGNEAYVGWGDSCDVVIDAADASVKTMVLKGNLDTQLYVGGNVQYVKNFKLKYGAVGDTDFYGPEIGLGCTSLIPPSKILIQWGWTTAPLLGVAY